jgi:hypothetical protein
MFTYVQNVQLLKLLKKKYMRVLLEKLIVAQLVKMFPEFYGTRNFITAFTVTSHGAFPVRDASSPRRHTLFNFHFNIILPYKPMSPKCSLQVFLLKFCIHFSCLHACFTFRLSMILDLMTLTVFYEEYKLLSSSLCNFLQPPVSLFLSDPTNILHSNLFSNTL